MILKRELKDLESRFFGIKIDFFVFMPSHCHIIFIFRNAQVKLSAVVQSFKSITTLKLKKAGFNNSIFWQKNYYEHIIRNDESLNRIREYIKQNPEKERFDFKTVGQQAGHLQFGS
jgi:REP element-mobilizing transposase RayT